LRRFVSIGVPPYPYSEYTGVTAFEARAELPQYFAEVVNPCDVPIGLVGFSKKPCFVISAPSLGYEGDFCFRHIWASVVTFPADFQQITCKSV